MKPYLAVCNLDKTHNSPYLFFDNRGENLTHHLGKCKRIGHMKMGWNPFYVCDDGWLCFCSIALLILPITVIYGRDIHSCVLVCKG